MRLKPLANIELFPTLIDKNWLASPARRKRLNRDLTKDAHGMMKVDQAGWKWSKSNYAGGYTSYSSMANLHLRFPPFMELKTLIDQKVSRFARRLDWDLGRQKLTMTTCWVNVMPHLSHHSLHLHPQAVISGTYYVATPKGSGSLKFEDPRLGLLMHAPPRRATAPARVQPFFTIKPQAGELLLWESWLRHEVTANQSQTPRISVSFNYE